MGKYNNTKSYKSTSFTPKNKRVVDFSEINYQDLVFTTLREKYQYFIIGFGVLFGIIAGTSYFMLKNTSFQKVVATNRKIEIVQPTLTPTLIPTRVIAKAVVTTQTPTVKVEAKPKEVVNTPKVDAKKAAEAAKAKPGVGAAKYIVQPGDSLWKIAEKAYKSGFNYKDVVAYNKIANPNTIIAGQEILLPTVKPQLPTDPTVLAQGGVGGPSDDAAISATMTDPVTNTASNYTVVKGDTLWSIAARTLGDGFSWKDIAKANGVSNPEKLEVGTTLVIPR